jgi:UDP-2,4-diacetamido-2,4,6-trideoxy-beta-L-altropyranose hydrolase
MHVLFRTDASAAIGTGHVMRCIALAQAMHDTGDEVAFVSLGLEERLNQEKLHTIRISAAPYSKEDARETAWHAKKIGMEWVVVDGYGFDAHYQQALKEEGLQILFLDDFGHADSYCADIVLNQNVSAREDLYQKRTPNIRLLLGPQYALLRREFCAWKERRNARTGPVRNLLVTFGGADPENVTTKVIRALARTAYTGSVTVVAGTSNPHLQDLKQLAAPFKTIRLITDARDMSALMAEADLAIAAGGTTSWELLFMGVPFLTGTFAENQVKVAEALEDQELAENVGWYPDRTEEGIAERLSRVLDDEQWRTAHSKKGLATVDGEGARRVRDAMRGRVTVTLRDATMDDARMLFDWANDSRVRTSSWEDHRKWMEKKLADPCCRMFIGMDGQSPIGQIRFDIRGDGDAEIDVHVDPFERGKGYGTLLIQNGMQRFFDMTEVRTVHAFAKMDNDASRKAFLKAGFGEQGRATVRGNEVYHLVTHRQ